MDPLVRDVALIVHFIGLAMGLGTSFAFMVLGIVGSKMEPEERLKFSLKTFALSKLGYTGLALLIISGLLLMSATSPSRWELLSAMPWLIVKLVLVLVLGAIIGIVGSTVRKVKNGGDPATLSRVRPLGMAALLTSIAIVILAVLIFP